MLVGEPHLTIRLQMGINALLLHLIVPLSLFISQNPQVHIKDIQGVF